MSLKRKLKRKTTNSELPTESLMEIGRLAGGIADHIAKEVDAGVNTYAMALALETQVQLFCEQGGIPRSQLSSEAHRILRDKRLKEAAEKEHT